MCPHGLIVLCSERANHPVNTALVIPHYPQIKTLLSRLLSLRAESRGTSFESRCSLHDTSKLFNDPENIRRNNVFLFAPTIKIASPYRLVCSSRFLFSNETFRVFCFLRTMFFSLSERRLATVLVLRHN